MTRLDGKRALVTGGDSGIGRAIAETFAAAGADVVVTFHSDRSGADEVGRAIEAAGRQSVIEQCDVGSETDVAQLFAEIERRLGGLDILVNNAGTSGKGTPVAETLTEDFDRVLRTNLYGPFFCCRAFVAARSRAGLTGGKIINVTSVHEVIPSPNSAAYGASKGGLLTFTRSLALEVAPQKMNVNAIAPGQIRTPMTARTQDPEVFEREMKQIPWHRPGEPWEVAKLALYLASDDADYVTGQSFTIDGGLEMNWGQGA